MNRSASISLLGSEFDDFLFASIGEDRNEMLLTVLTALARRDVDPWLEAAELALLPREIATQRLISLIATLPDAPSACRDPGAIAGRLITLLPHRARFIFSSHIPSIGVGRARNFRRVISMTLTLMVIVLGALCIPTSLQPSAQTGKGHARAFGTALAKTPPPTSGK